MGTRVIKVFGFEIEFGGRWVYASVPHIGEMCFEIGSRVRGRWWADYMTDDKGNLSLYFGSTYIVLSSFSRAPYAA